MASSDESLETLLADVASKLDSCSINSGDNIELSQDSDGVSISADFTLTSKFKRWLLKTHRKVSALKELEAGRNLKIERGPHSLTLHAEPSQGGSAKNPLPAAELEYPFKAVVNSDNTVTILGYNESKKRYFRDYVTLGLNRIEVPETIFSTITEDSWIYLTIQYTSNAYSVSLTKDTTLPDEATAIYIIPIAFIKASDGKAKAAYQLQYGPVEGSGRIF